jgi:hypothetical protein
MSYVENNFMLGYKYLYEIWGNRLASEVYLMSMFLSVSLRFFPLTFFLFAFSFLSVSYFLSYQYFISCFSIFVFLYLNLQWELNNDPSTRLIQWGYLAAMPLGVGNAATDAVIAHSGDLCCTVSTLAKYFASLHCIIYVDKRRLYTWSLNLWFNGFRCSEILLSTSVKQNSYCREAENHSSAQRITTFYWTRKFINVFIKALQRILFWGIWIQSILSQPVYEDSF